MVRVCSGGSGFGLGFQGFVGCLLGLGGDGAYSNEMFLNKLEFLASTTPVRSGAMSWAQRVESARSTYNDDMDRISSYLENLNHKDKRFKEKGKEKATAHKPTDIRPGGRNFTGTSLIPAYYTDPNAWENFLSEERCHFTEGDLTQAFASLTRQGVCWGCLQPGHFFLDKNPDGTWRRRGEPAAAKDFPQVEFIDRRRRRQSSHNVYSHARRYYLGVAHVVRSWDLICIADVVNHIPGSTVAFAATPLR